MPEISILILTKNENTNIGRCLESICSQRCESSLEVLLIDSGSTDSTLEIASKFPVRIVQIAPEDFHHARTRNFAASLATGNYLVYLAADAFPASNTWLNGLLSSFEDPRVGAVYGRHLPKENSKTERRQALETLYGASRILKEPGNGLHLGYRYYHFSTVNAAIRKSVWEATRFPEEIKVFEDVGIAKRILDTGWHIVYEPEAAVYHSHDYPIHMLFKRYFDIGVVYQRLGIWNLNSRKSVVRDGWQTVKNKMKLIGSGKNPLETASALAYDGAKYLGLLLGRNEAKLPVALKKRISAFRLFD